MVAVFQAVLIYLMFAGYAVAQSDTGLGALHDYLPPTGQTGTWRYVNTGQSFEIENIGDANAIQYFYAAPDDDSEGQRTIEAEFIVFKAGDGSAGVLYGLNAARDRYHLLALDGQGKLTLFRRDPTGFQAIVEQISSAFEPGKANRLTIIEQGDEIAFSLNGTALGAIAGALFGYGSVGIAAIGDVHASFTYFAATANE